MTFALAVEIALTVLLAATLAYCAVLERRLAQLRKGQDGFKQTIAELNAAITTAGASMRMLQSTASGAAETLNERMTRARGLIDELSLLATSGERVAERIERGASVTSERARMAAPPVLANRLDALRPARTERAAERPQAAGHVR